MFYSINFNCVTFALLNMVEHFYSCFICEQIQLSNLDITPADLWKKMWLHRGASLWPSLTTHWRWWNLDL